MSIVDRRVSSLRSGPQCNRYHSSDTHKCCRRFGAICKYLNAKILPYNSNIDIKHEIQGCARWYTIVMGDGCTSVEQKFSLTAAQFFTLNPEVKTDCTNLGLGEAYCVKAIGQTGGGGSGVTIPANVVSGTDTAVWLVLFLFLTLVDQSTFRIVQNMTLQLGMSTGYWRFRWYPFHLFRSGDTCPIIETRNNVSDQIFRALNPEVSST